MLRPIGTKLSIVNGVNGEKLKESEFFVTLGNATSGRDRTSDEINGSVDSNNGRAKQGSQKESGTGTDSGGGFEKLRSGKCQQVRRRVGQATRANAALSVIE